MKGLYIGERECPEDGVSVAVAGTQKGAGRLDANPAHSAHVGAATAGPSDADLVTGSPSRSA